jgi:hypothetical protein
MAKEVPNLLANALKLVFSFATAASDGSSRLDRWLSAGRLTDVVTLCVRVPHSGPDAFRENLTWNKLEINLPLNLSGSAVTWSLRCGR